MRISPHLMFDGRCAEAFGRYQALLGGELRMLTFGDSPLASEIEPRWHERILHATLSLDGFELAGADVLPEQFARPQGFSVLLTLDDPGEARRIFDALSDGGEIHFPIQSTFWSDGFGVLVDRFAIPWEVTCPHGAAQ